MKQYIFILGVGNVGREFIKRVIDKDSKKNHANPTEILGVAGSKSMIFDPRGINSDILRQLTTSKEKAKEILEKGAHYTDINEILQVVKRSNLDKEIIFVDLTAGKEDLLKFHKNIIENSNYSIVTANKNPVSLYTTDDFNLLTNFHHRYDFNVTVMAGAGIVNFINERKEIQDKINNIKGCFSGTLGYILSELEKQEKSFSEIVKTAKKEGYTEPNPWDDLNGLDVARKILILARCAGYDVTIKDVAIEPLIDESFSKLSGDIFFQSLEEKNSYFAELQQQAQNKNEVLRYVGEMINVDNKIILKVGLQNIPKDSEFGTLTGTANLVVIDTETLAEPIPHIIKSRGAGLSVTADAIRAGVLKLMPYGVKNNKV